MLSTLEQGKKLRSSSSEITWVRKALAALGITVDDLSDRGECKAALITHHYQGLKTTASEVWATEASGAPT